MVKKNKIKKKFSAWKEWDARAYLFNYFSTLEIDEIEVINFLVKYLPKVPRDKPILEFGTGPMSIHAIVAAKYVPKIDIADFLPQNRKQIKVWQENKEKDFSWKKFIKYTLKVEGESTSEKSIKEREDLARKKIGRYFFSDAHKSNPLYKYKNIKKYSTLMSFFCIDSITDNKDDWRKYMKNMLSLVSLDGHVILAALRKTKSYPINDTVFPSANIDEKDLKKALLDNGFNKDSIVIQVKKTSTCANHGYESIILAYAYKGLNRK